MKKILSIGLVLIGLLAITFAMLPIEQVETLTPVATVDLSMDTEVIKAQPIIYQASFLDFFKDLDWMEIITLLFAGGLMAVIAAIRKAIKEMKDVKDKFVLYWADKKLTPEEKEDLIAELGEAILAVDSVWGVISGLFKKAKKKV